MSTQLEFNRRTVLAGIGASALGICLGGCGGQFALFPKPRLYIALVDTSDSVSGEDWASYQQSLANLADVMDASQVESERDRLVVGAIDHQPYTKAAPLFDVSIASTGLVDDDTQVPAQREAIKARCEGIARQSKSGATRIFDAVMTAADLIASERGTGGELAYDPQIVLLSDMIEESPIYNMKRNPIEEDHQESVLDQLEASGLLPDLSGAAVHVSGGAGNNAAVYARNRAFWETYFKRSNGELAAYSRLPLSFHGLG